jgi:dihydrofolate reductase
MKLILGPAAVAQNRVIGSHNTLPWYIPEDLKHFKQITMGKTVLMGKNTYDSIINRLGKPLPGRKSVVVSRQTDFKPPEDVLIFHDLPSALEGLKDLDEVWVIGGGQIYSQLIDKADKLVLTEVHKEVDGDVLFPEWNKNEWRETSREDHPEFSFVEYERIK